jgi:hypothetical protein
MSAPKSKKDCGLVAVAVVKTQSDIAALLEATHVHAGCCAICAGPPPFRFGAYIPAEEERQRWRIGGFGFALCLDCFWRPEASKAQLAKLFHELARNRSAEPGVPAS